MNELGFSEYDLKVVKEASRRLAEKMPDVNLSALLDEMIDSYYREVFTAMDVIRSVMKDHPEYRNIDLLKAMNKYLDSVMVGGKQ